MLGFGYAGVTYMDFHSNDLSSEWYLQSSSSVECGQSGQHPGERSYGYVVVFRLLCWYIIGRLYSD